MKTLKTLTVGLIACLATIPSAVANPVNPHHYLNQVKYVSNLASMGHRVSAANNVQVGGNPYDMYVNQFIGQIGWIGFPNNDPQWLEIGQIDGYTMGNISQQYLWANAVRHKGHFWGYNYCNNGTCEYHNQPQTSTRNFYLMTHNGSTWDFLVGNNYVGSSPVSILGSYGIVGIESASTGNNFTNGARTENWQINATTVSNPINFDTSPNMWNGNSQYISPGIIQYNKNNKQVEKDFDDIEVLKSNPESQIISAEEIKKTFVHPKSAIDVDIVSGTHKEIKEKFAGFGKTPTIEDGRKVYLLEAKSPVDLNASRASFKEAKSFIIVDAETGKLIRSITVAKQNNINKFPVVSEN
jgi:hypothetical protein